jgi:hypothetical protein
MPVHRAIEAGKKLSGEDGLGKHADAMDNQNGAEEFQ